MQLNLFPKPFEFKGISKEAVDHNAKIKNNYGPRKFTVEHSGGLVSNWSADDPEHLEYLLKIEKGCGYILSIDKVTEL